MIARSPTLLVLADDLTGANDAGVQFALAGIRAIVLVDHKVEEFPSDFPVVVVNTESRHVSPEIAAERVRRVAQRGVESGVKWFYKKTDSTLRGNIGAELEALADIADPAFLPFVPALPDLGRTTLAGIHYVDGIPLAETAFARDPLNPVRDSDVCRILARQTRVPVSSASTRSHRASKGEIVVFDCESNEELAVLARDFAKSVTTFSGSVGLMKYLGKHLHIASPPVDPVQLLSPVLFVNGSLNERSLAQVRHAVGLVPALRLAPEQLFADDVAYAIPPRGRNLLLYSVSRREELLDYKNFAVDRGLAEERFHFSVAQRTGRFVDQMLCSGGYRTVVIFGGDTLSGVAHAAGWHSFIPAGEFLPGISVSRPGPTSGVTLVSKSGGFGPIDIIEQILRHTDSE